MMQENKNRIEEVIAGKESSPSSLEANFSAEAADILGKIDNAIAHDGKLSESDLNDLVLNLEKTRIKIRGEDFSVSQVLTEGFQNNMKYWDVLMSGSLSADQVYEAVEEITHLPREVAEALVAETKDWDKGSELRFDSLVELSPEVASVLAKVPTGITFKKIPLTAEIAKAFSRFGGYGLEFSSVTEISPEAAENISSMSVDFFALPGLQILSEESAKYLLGLKGVLMLSTVPLSEKTSQILSERTGALACEGDIFDEKIMNNLLKCKGPLHFSSTYLSEKIAFCFSHREGEVHLASLQKVENDKVFSYLAQVKGELVLTSLETLSAKGAEYLITHQGPLDLRWLDPSDDVLQILSRFPDLEKLELGPLVKEKVKMLRDDLNKK